MPFSAAEFLTPTLRLFLFPLIWFPRMPPHCFVWMICTWIPSRSRMSRPWTVTTCPVPLVVLQERMERQSSLSRTPARRESCWLKRKFKPLVSVYFLRDHVSLSGNWPFAIIAKDSSVIRGSLSNLLFFSIAPPFLQSHSHPRLVPEHQDCSWRYCGLDSRIPTRQGLLNIAHKGCAYEGEILKS